MQTIVLIHGAYVTSGCWDLFKERCEQQGYTCLAPTWPYDDRPVDELRRQPDLHLCELGIAEIVDYYATIIAKLPQPPVLIGHSFGGLFVQLLLDRGLGCAGVAIDPAPPRGVLPGPNATWSGLPVLLAFRGWRKLFMMSPKQFHWSFAHTLPEAELRPIYEKYVIPTPGRIFYQALFGKGTGINFQNSRRAPLLITAGSLDRAVDASMNRANFKKYRHSSAVTEFKEFPGRTHWLIASPGWEEVADYALSWTKRQVSAHEIKV